MENNNKLIQKEHLDNGDAKYDVECSECGKGYNWEDIDGKYPPKNPDFVKKLLTQYGFPDEMKKIAKAFYIKCECGKTMVVAEVLEMCEPDKIGFSDSAYLAISFKK